ncbi:uncharacterized protein DUF3578 [Lentzea atacamensis]|uniref:Uncharacterized protein DUF3578 n=1 Tax=Lentzea atacamensis TaxID=531938 RepID=A0ABX9E634_9PSEU|nr:uncharacterized protein DUF3578 [Lentzea atacamensis]
MRVFLRDVLLLQPEWDSENTPAMQERGRLLGQDLAGWLREHLPALTRNAPIEIDDWNVHPSDGAGNKNVIPWVRVHSSSRSPKATLRWYVVYLFEAQDHRAYPALMQGASEWKNREAQPRPRWLLRQRAQAMRKALEP